MPRTRRLLTVAAGLSLAVVLTPNPGTSARAEAPPNSPTTTAPAEAPTSLSQLAAEGRFADVLDALKADPHAAAPPQTASLIAGLERYRTHEKERRQRRETAYQEALENLATHVAEDDLDKALLAAIEAHSIADEPLLVLRNPAVIELVTKTEIAAKQAELAEDWVEASVLFGRLHLLFEKDNRYRAEVKRVSSHLRVLALYAPDVLRKLQEARAIRHGRADELQQTRPDDETWQSRLNGINTGMLHECIKTATERHIDGGGYEKLLSGSIDPLLTLLDTPALGEIFPGLADAEAAETFRVELLRMKADLDHPDRPLTQFRARSRIDEVIANNRRTVNLPVSVIAYEMTEGALNTLDDFSSMYWPEDVDFLSRSTQGAFPGIGVQISRRLHADLNQQTDKPAPEASEGAEPQADKPAADADADAPDGEQADKPVVTAYITVVSPLTGSPAMAAGIKADDIIFTVDGQDASNWSLNKAVREITGPIGTPVVLGIKREGLDEPLEVTVKRGRIEIESVKGWSHAGDGEWDHWIDKDAGIGYVRLTQFIPQSAHKIDLAIAKLRDEGQLNSLIIDLRHNPGGLLTSAIRIVDSFLDGGPILYTVNGEGKRNHGWPAHRRGTYPNFELIILINRGSASASEILSGALQDRGRAFIVGDRSYGKGSVQDVYWYPSPPPRAKYGLKVTTQYYQLPGGRIIHRKPDSKVWGIDPDLAINVTNQTVAWNLELRQEIDVFRDATTNTIEAEMTKPWVRFAGLEPVDADADNAKDKVTVRLPKPSDLLELGLDPQLEAALLVLKTHQVFGDTTVAKAAK